MSEAQSRTAKELATAVARVQLECFLASGQRLDFHPRGEPRISILMLVCNRAEVTLACLQSLLSGANVTPFELILVDNGSTDRTATLLEQVDGAIILTNATNVGYPIGVNQAAARARGEYLLLLNNDTEVLGRSLDTAVEYLDQNDTVGMVGGRIVLLDGTLQEAGCAIRGDGWPLPIAREKPADDPNALFVRTVDYCSGAFLMIRRAAFEAVGRLDEVYSPGYFEDPDLALRLRRLGYSAVYHPGITILHYENATSQRLFSISELVQRNHAVFQARYADWLQEQPSPPHWCPYRNRRADDTAVNVLIFPGPNDPVGPGQLVRILERLDAMPTVLLPHDATAAAHLLEQLPNTVERVPLDTAQELEELLDERPGYFDLALTWGELAEELRTVLTRRTLRQARWQDGQFRFVA
ncbi:MAG: glycosyltransferase family 2 protein [Bacteroidales bacterium]|nr:glycosyltransferase family 2 protein [Bacteroidales bacterium]